MRVIAASKTVASKTFSIRANRIATVRLKVNGNGRALLRRTSKTRVNVRVETRGSDRVLRKRTLRLTFVKVR